MHVDRLTLPSSRLDEIRVGGVAQIGLSGILSGIDKQTVEGALQISADGIVGDHQSEAFHGGLEKAVLQYPFDHYSAWAAEFPELAERFRSGGFGENFVVAGMSESNICIGDYVRAGTALLQVSESRQPCFKLNHRFGHAGISRRAQETGRTGWLYRVIQPGEVAAGDAIAVVERPLPDWPISRLQRYLYDITDDLQMAETLSQLTHLSPGFRALFAKRVASGKPENFEDRLSNGPLALRPTVWFEARIVEARDEAVDVMSFRVMRTDNKAMADFTAGAHIDVKVNNGWTRSYSLCHLPRQDGYRFAVRKSEDGRGGSKHIHDVWRVGDHLLISEPRNHFELSEMAERHLFIAGGIGITPFLSMIEHLERRNIPWQLHYCMRDVDKAPYARALLSTFPGNVTLHATGGDHSKRLDLNALLEDQSVGTHVYCCGPATLMTAVRDSTKDWPDGSVHFEAFAAPQPADLAQCSPFEITLHRSGMTLVVPENATLLDVLEGAGIAVESSCRTGTCGTCRVGYLAGDVDHRDLFLSREGRKTGLMCCVSRGRSALQLDL